MAVVTSKTVAVAVTTSETVTSAHAVRSIVAPLAVKPAYRSPGPPIANLVLCVPDKAIYHTIIAVAVATGAVVTAVIVAVLVAPT